MPQAAAFLWQVAVEAAFIAYGAGAPAWLAAAVGYATFGAEIVGVVELAQALVPSTPTPSAQRVTVRQTLPQRYRGCGYTRMGGGFLVDYAQGQNIRQVVAFADVKVAIDRYWLNQDEVFLSSNQVQFTSGGPYSRVKLYAAYGQTSLQPFPTLHAAYPAIWPSTSTGTGITMGLLEASNGKIEEFSKDFPRGPQLQYNVGGWIDVFYDWRDNTQSRTDPTTWKTSSNPVVCLVNELWRYRDYDWDARFAPTLSILTDEANACDDRIPVKNVLSKITADCSASPVRLRNIAGLSVGRTLYLAGQAVTVTGFGAYHPIDGGTEVTFSGTLSSPVAAGAIARWVSDPANPATVARYEAHGRWLCSENEADTVRRFRECMDGFMAFRPSDGAVVIRCGRYVAPTVTIGLDEIIDYDWDGFVDIGKIVNERVPSYVEPAADFNQIDSTPWRDDDSVNADGLSSQPFAPGLVQNNSQVRRLAKRQSSQDQQPLRNLVLKASAYRCLGERFIQLPSLGLEVDEANGSVVEVVDDPQIIDNGMHILLPVKVVSAADWSWDYLTEEGNGPADVAAPLREILSKPTISSVALVYDTVATGQSGVRLKVSTTAPQSRDDITWSIRTRKAGSTSWDERTDRSLSGQSVDILSNYVATNGSVEVETAYLTGAGTLSPWSDASTINTSPASDTATPEAATTPTLVSWDSALRLTAPAVSGARTYRWRLFRSDGTTLVATRTTLTPELTYTAQEAVADGPLRSYVVKLAGVNGVGVGSEAATAVLSKAALAAPSTTTAADGAYIGEVDFAAVTGAKGYLVAYSSTSGFTPGAGTSSQLVSGSPAYINGLMAGTFYARVAAFDEWSSDPSLLNFGPQASFVITSGATVASDTHNVGGVPSATILSNIAAAQSAASAAQSDATTALSNILSEISRAQGAEGTLTTNLASLNTTVVNNYSSLSASISSEALARTNADSALAATITSLTTTVNSNTAAITSEAATRASADSAISANVTTLQAQLAVGANLIGDPDFRQGGAGWSLVSGSLGGAADPEGPCVIYHTVSGTSGASYIELAERPVATIDPSAPYSLQVRLYSAGIAAATTFSRAVIVWLNSSGSQVGFNLLQTNVSAGWTTYKLDATTTGAVTPPSTAVSAKVVLDLASSSGNLVFNGADIAVTKIKLEKGSYCTPFSNDQVSADLKSEGVARASADSALAASITSLTATVGGNTAAITSEAATRASADSSLSSSITSLTATVGSNTAAISTNATAISTLTGQVYSTYTLTANANGNIAGMSLLAAGGATPVSAVVFEAANFQIKSGTNSAFAPFSYDATSGTLTLQNIIIDGSAQIKSASIDTLQIKNGAVTTTTDMSWTGSAVANAASGKYVDINPTSAVTVSTSSVTRVRASGKVTLTTNQTSACLITISLCKSGYGPVSSVTKLFQGFSGNPTQDMDFYLKDTSPTGTGTSPSYYMRATYSNESGSGFTLTVSAIDAELVAYKK